MIVLHSAYKRKQETSYKSRINTYVAFICKTLHNEAVKAEDTVTFRLPVLLKDEVKRISEENGLTMSKAYVQLLLKAVAAYREDGVLIDGRNREVMQSLENPQPQPEVVRPQKRRAG